MPRKKKKDIMNIKSNETKIIFGLIFFVIGLALLIAPFVGEDTIVFIQITQIFGWPSIVWGIAALFISLNLLTKGKSFNNWFQFTGIIMLSVTLNTLFSFWIPRETLENNENLNLAGGLIGKTLHLGINNGIGDILELVVILIVLIVAFSLITSVTLEQIAEFVEESLKNIRLGEGLNKGIEIGNKQNGDLVISGLDNDNNGKIDDLELENDDHNVVNEPLVQQTDVEPRIEEDFKEGDTDLTPSQPKYTEWVYPNIAPLQDPEIRTQDKGKYKDLAKVIEQTLKSFGIAAKVVEISIGPTVVRYALSLSVGTKVAKIKNLNNDLALALASKSSSVRIEAPIPGTSYVGIEIPNPTPNYVYIKEMAKKLIPRKNLYQLPLLLGKDITGQTTIKDLVEIPHLLVAGATGTGKSIGINSMLAGLLLTKTPDEVKFIMVDPKMGVEMAAYNGIPHLLTPVITDNELVVNALQWCIEEMMKRYRMLKQVHTKKLTEYNKKLGYTALPYIVVVIDEMADLMLTSGPDVETKIQRLAQMGRAVGIHLILATQKPTVNVITGLIKSNVPGRIAYAVATAMDSRVILDQTGAENLLGKGDMLFKDQTMPKSIRIQGTYISTEDTEDIIKQIKEQVSEEELEYSEEITSSPEKGADGRGAQGGTDREPEFKEALEIAMAEGKVSASLLQRRLRIGYNKAARLIENLEDAKAIGPQDGSKPREVLVSSVNQVIGQDGSQDQ